MHQCSVNLHSVFTVDVMNPFILCTQGPWMYLQYTHTTYACIHHMHTPCLCCTHSLCWTHVRTCAHALTHPNLQHDSAKHLCNVACPSLCPWDSCADSSIHGSVSIDCDVHWLTLPFIAGCKSLRIWLGLPYFAGYKFLLFRCNI